MRVSTAHSPLSILPQRVCGARVKLTNVTLSTRTKGCLGGDGILQPFVTTHPIVVHRKEYHYRLIAIVYVLHFVLFFVVKNNTVMFTL